MGHTNFELCKISNKKLAWATNKKKKRSLFGLVLLLMEDDYFILCKLLVGSLQEV